MTAMGSGGVSACLVIRNEERCLARCLESLRGVIDEIIVVHDGVCEDRSLEIAGAFGARIFVRPFIGEGEAHRPYGFEMASGDWILWIDADEFLSREAREAIPELVRSGHADAYAFNWPLFNGTRYIRRGPFSRLPRPCLFRRSKLRFVGITHASPWTSGRLVERLDLQMEHRPLYDNFTWKKFKDKWVPWARLEAKQLLRYRDAPRFPTYLDPDDPVFRQYAWKVRHPFLSGLRETARYLGGPLRRGLLPTDLLTWKILLLQGARIVLTHFYIWREASRHAP